MFSRFFIYRPIFASVIAIVIVLVGAMSIPLLPIDDLMDFFALLFSKLKPIKTLAKWMVSHFRSATISTWTTVTVIVFRVWLNTHLCFQGRIFKSVRGAK